PFNSFYGVTDANGRYRLAVPPGAGRLCYEAPRRRYRPMVAPLDGVAEDFFSVRELSGEPGQTIQVPDLIVRQPRDVTIRVTDPRRQALGKTAIAVRLMNLDHFDHAVEVVTDAEGRFTL
ncbi:unnamed protein product, partial [Phaeothamnion confervicola]